MPQPGRHVFVLGDSLAFHGPERPIPFRDPRLFPNVMAAHLGDDVTIDLLARPGYTARDAWWALTRDPRAWGEYIHRAHALVLAVGGFDQLPAAVPSYLREGIPYLPRGPMRHWARRGLASKGPWVMRATGGRIRQLPQAATDRYLQRIIEAVEVYRPGIPRVLMGPSPFESTFYPVPRPHALAVDAARRWAAHHDVGFVDIDPLVVPSLRAGNANPDGMHWGWDAHDAVGRALAGNLLDQGFC